MDIFHINTNDINRVAFSIAGYDVYWYGVIICSAILVAMFVASHLAKKKGYNPDMVLSMAVVLLPSGILGARLFSVIFEEGLNLSDFFNFRTGGMSIIGAVIGGAIALTIYSFCIKDKDKLKYFDTVCVVLLLAQAIGRWGNFFNSEVYGMVINADSIFAFFPICVFVDGVPHLALFFIESVADLYGFFILRSLYLGTKRSGYVLSFYLIIYGLIRTILENLRDTKFILKANTIPISFVCSIAMIVVGTIICVVLNIMKNKSKEKINVKKA